MHADNRVAWSVGLLFAAISLWSCPGLYQFDGTTYFLYAANPWTHLNPHHLLWVPLEHGLQRLADPLGTPGVIVFLQRFGIAVTSLTLVLLCRLLMRLGAERWLAASLTLAVGFSPPVWFLSGQNLPYPLFFLGTVVYLQALSRSPISVRQSILAMVGLLMAVFVHQMAILLLPAGALILWREKKSGSRAAWYRWGWTLTALGIIGSVYLVLGWALGNRSVHDYAVWGTHYMHVIHPLRLSGWDVFPQAVMGFFRSILQMQPLENRLYRSWSPHDILQIYLLVGAVCMLMCGVLFFRDRKRITHLATVSPALAVCLISGSAFSLFAILWEPSNFNFWGIVLFPMVVALVVLLPRGVTAFRILLSVMALALCFWNVSGNREWERPSAGLRPLEDWQLLDHQLSSNDIYLALNRASYGAVNYDLLFTCLEIASHNQGLAVVEDFVLSGSAHWQQDLRETIQSTLDSGGNVYVSSGFRDAALYADLQRLDPFSTYRRPGYDTLSWTSVQAEMDLFWKEFVLTPAFTLRTETVWRVERVRRV